MPTEGLRGLAEKTPSVAHFPAYPSRSPLFSLPTLRRYDPLFVSYPRVDRILISLPHFAKALIRILPYMAGTLKLAGQAELLTE